MPAQQSQTPSNNIAEMNGTESNSEPSEGLVTAGSTSYSSTDAAESSASASTKACANCGKIETDPEKPLKPCSKCQTVRYCSRDCQKADWKVHKKTCAAAAQIYAQTANFKPAAAPSAPKKEAHSKGLRKWQFDT